MRRAAFKRSVAVCEPIVSTVLATPRADEPSGSAPSAKPEELPTTEIELSSSGTFIIPKAEAIDNKAERRRQLAIAIRQRIESRLVGRIRQLAVRFAGDTVILEGNCSTYYSKQLAQHAALGVLENESLDNAIVVSVPS